MSNLLSLYLTPCRRCLARLPSVIGYVYTLPCAQQKVGQSVLSTSAVRWHSTVPESHLAFSDNLSGEKEQGGSKPTGKKQRESFRIRNLKKRVNKVYENEWIQPEGYDTGIVMYNSLTRSKEPLILPRGKFATWYSCGPTVYDKAHIGHASSYTRMDIIRRILTDHFGIDVVLLMGITDIDDKIIRKSHEMNLTIDKVTAIYEEDFFNDMAKLRILPPTLTTRVTDYVPEVIKFVESIMDNGLAYKTSKGTVYFDVDKFGRYGRLQPQNPDILYREPLDKEKLSARDFALWKAAKPGEPSWDSPWGPGRPGWHIECSTMASGIFGEQLDIHSGGDDLKFPHHENEMAQSEACFGCHQWTNYWLHTGYLHQKQETTKMSKSLKNTISVKALLKAYTPNQFRLFCMMVPYRTPIEYGPPQMSKAKAIVNNWIHFNATVKSYIKGDFTCAPLDESYLLQSLTEAKENVDLAFRDDFDTPKAVDIVDGLVNKVNLELSKKRNLEMDVGSRSSGTLAMISSFLNRFTEILGIDEQTNTAGMNASTFQRKYTSMVDQVVDFRCQVRRYAMNPNESETDSGAVKKLSKEDKKKQQQLMRPLFKHCDDLREKLKDQGIEVKDIEDKSAWNRIHRVDIIEEEIKTTEKTSKPTPE
ncbi:hypothetical protein CAPTEDRAFT_159831 [Capitella teleta]|uniref:cysteine--tRNA ligase n=1 Tax=Capitella teleta TaxID=283909 RepID=R7UYA3_CAPTE|nr:hypothetical protein CAPTEDRAFT_159831 [Capitella teleta]|eukprot:ELU08927.1 hypothetical protein CAPTEDRAFT_159831 [Capitella teleta]